MKVVRKKIEAITYFTTNTYPQPIRFRILGDNDEAFVVHLDKINYVEKDIRAGNPILIYDCQARLENRSYLLQLIYDIGSFTWYLFKIWSTPYTNLNLIRHKPCLWILDFYISDIHSLPVMLFMIFLVRRLIVSHNLSITFSKLANISFLNPNFLISFQICSIGFISGV